MRVKSYVGVLGYCLLLLAFPIALPMTSHIDEHKNPQFESFPLQLGSWTGKDMPVDDKTYEILETRNVLSRIYEDPSGRQMHLLLVGSYKDRRVAHPPEVCYMSSNFVILNESDGKVEVKGSPIEVKRFLARNEKDPRIQEQVLYVYKVGERFTTNYYAQQLQFAVDKLSKKDSQVLLIRLAVPLKPGIPEKDPVVDFQEFLSLVLSNV